MCYSGMNNDWRRVKKVSLADLIVLGGTAAVEKTAKDAGVDVKVGGNVRGCTARQRRCYPSRSF